MNLMDLLKEKLQAFIFNTENPNTCYELGLVYEALGHTAAALTFFLKTAERTTDTDLQYECIIRMHKIFLQQGNRNTTVIAMAQRAIIENPTRPEAYYFLSRFYENVKDHHQALMYAELGMKFADFNSKPLRGDVGFPGEYSMLFQKGVNSWWWGLREQTLQIMKKLNSEYADVMDSSHAGIVKSNLAYMIDTLKWEDGENEKFDWGYIGEYSTYEVFERENFKENTYQRYFSVDEGDVVVDFGASVGPFGYTIAKNKPSKLYCFEPSTQLFPTLEKNLRNKNLDVVCINKAISGSDEPFDSYGVWMYDPAHPPRLEALTSDYAVKIDAMSFKTFIKQYKINRIDFMKTDCEGSEYDIFNRENYDWISKNVKKVAGEIHLFDEKQKEGFKVLRDLYLKNMKFYALDMSNNDITDQVFSDDFIEKYLAIQLYIDNRQKWAVTQWPTLEITTNIAEKGCVVDCAFCPQRTLEKTYKDDTRILTFDNFTKVIDKLPKQVRITFAGFTEPWLNKRATDMLLYAYEQGHPVAAFATGVGMKPEDVYRLKNVKFDNGPNGGLCLHLPDQERIAKHPINANYIKVVEAFKEVGPSIEGFYVMCMSNQVHESVRHLFPTAHVPEFWSRAGNLLTEVGVKPDLAKVMGRVKSIYHGEEDYTCNQPEDMYHNVMLPNGDVSLCCQDYSLKHILGNLFTEEYNDIIPKTQSCFDLCRYCENGVKPK